MSPQPPLADAAELAPQLAQRGWAVVDADALCGLSGVAPSALAGWEPHSRGKTVAIVVDATGA